MSADQPPVRVTDADRDAVVDRLRHATVEGYLTLEEFGDRTGLALAAASSDQLAPLVADLPSPPPSDTAPPTRPRRETRWIFGILGGGDRTGRWRLAPRTVVVNVLGGADLDLRHASVTAAETRITVLSLLGGSDIVVPDGVEVDLSGFALLGSNQVDAARDAPSSGAPVIRVRAFSLLGGTDVTSGRR